MADEKDDLSEKLTPDPKDKVFIEVTLPNRIFTFPRESTVLDIHGPELCVRDKKSKALLLRCYGFWAHRDVFLDEDGDPE